MKSKITNSTNTTRVFTRGQKAGALVVVLAGVILGTLESSILNVTYPTIARTFDVGVGDVVWAGLVYTLTIGSVAMATGALAGRLGNRNMYVAGFGVFGIATVACGFSENLILLCVFRVVQGLGYAMILGNGLAVLTMVFPPKQRGRVIGSLPIAVAVGISVGPVLGGEIIGIAGWRWVFWALAPPAFVFTLLAIKFLPDGGKSAEREKFDYAGLITSSACITLSVIALKRLSHTGGDWVSVGLLAISALSGVLFLWIELRAPHPLIPVRFILSNRIFFSVTMAGAASIVLIFSSITLMPFMMEELFGWDPRTSGRVLLVSPLMLSIFGPISGWITDRFGFRMTLCAVGLSFGIVGPLLIAHAPHDAEPWQLAWRMGLLGVGMGLFQTPNTTKFMNLVPKKLLGSLSGFQASIRTGGMTFGLALAGVMVSWFFLMITGEPAPAVEDIHPTPEAWAVFRYSFYCVAGVSALSLVVLLFSMGREPKPE